MERAFSVQAYERILQYLEDRDQETSDHLFRMAHHTRLIARGLGLSEDHQELLFRAAPLHDVGKIEVPDHILLKPGRLTLVERKIIQKHAVAGYWILRDDESPIVRMGAEMALSHHERFDGSGYPYGRAGEAIPLSGRICAVADVFDALISQRRYKKAWPLARVIAYLKKNRGAQFDPRVLDAFFAALPEVRRISEYVTDHRRAA